MNQDGDAASLVKLIGLEWSRIAQIASNEFGQPAEAYPSINDAQKGAEAIDGSIEWAEPREHIERADVVKIGKHSLPARPLASDLLFHQASRS